MKNTVLFTAALVLVAAALPAARAAAVFSDDFTDGDRAGWYKVNEGTAGNMAISIVDDTILGSGNALQMIPSGATRKGLVQSFADVTLAAGDFISLSFDYRFPFPTGVKNQQRNFRFGLFNNGATVVGSDLLAGDTASTDIAGNDAGYFGSISTGTSLGSRITKDTGTSGYLTGSPTTPSDISTILDATSQAGIADTSKHSAKIVILKELSGSATASLYMDSVLVGSGTDVTPTSLVFNEVVFCTYSTSSINLGYVIDNVVIDYTAVPEPATMALLGAGALAFLRRRIS